MYMYIPQIHIIIYCTCTPQDAFLAAKPGGDDEESLFYKVSEVEIIFV